eukprot:GDKJ01001040.1.p1 GENE.GDKJ01001040.1~~GDKJ01001040.1.p1  ORF type:complete len:1098 (+),score=298.31 GDKJ01001040.1:62-3355(+)
MMKLYRSVQSKRFLNGFLSGRFVSSINDWNAVKHAEFDLISDDFVKPLNLRVHQYKHRESGAKVLSFVSDDDEKVFAIGFFTPSHSSAGIPHILEHSVLAGSENYPLKDPFMNMLSGSMQTFLNAFTFSDYTLYPVASTHPEDFYNLANVYADAVLRPLATKEPNAFIREGHRLVVNDPTSPSLDADNFSIQGVVYNEMKGMMTMTDYVLYRRMLACLYPDHHLRHDSGGHPTAIRDLSFEEFKKFHSENYSPQKAHFFFYGNDGKTAEGCLKRLNFVSRQVKMSPSSPSQTQSAPAVTIPRELHEGERRVAFLGPATPGQDDGDSAIVCIRLPIDNTTIQGAVEMTILNILCCGLLAGGSNNGYLDQKLLQSGVGTQVMTYVDGTLPQPVFMVGSQGIPSRNLDVADEKKIDSSQRDQVENLIWTELDNISKLNFPFEKEKVLAIISKLEFAIREFSSPNEPRGITIAKDAVNPWVHHQDPVFALNASLDALQQVKKKVEDAQEDVFGDFIKKFLVHERCKARSVSIHLAASNETFKAVEEEERKFIASKVAQLSSEEKEKILQRTIQDRLPPALAEGEMSEKAKIDKYLPSLPLSSLADHSPIDLTPIHAATSHHPHSHVLPLNTNGIKYLSVTVDLSAIAQLTNPTFVSDLSFIISLLGKTPTHHNDRFSLFSRMSGVLPSFISSLEILKPPARKREFKPYAGVIAATFHASGLISNAAEMTQLLGEVLCDSEFTDKEYLAEVINANLNNALTASAESGDQFAAGWTSAPYNIHNMIVHEMSHSNAAARWKRYADELETDSEKLITRLTETFEIFKNNIDTLNMISVVSQDTSSNEMIDSAVNVLSAFPFAPALTAPAKPDWSGHLNLFPVIEDHTIPCVNPTILPPYKRSFPYIESVTKTSAQAMPIPSQISFTALTLPLEPGVIGADACSAVNRWFILNPLMEKIRLEGGAYGTSASSCPITSTLTLTSFRDAAPPLETYQKYREALVELIEAPKNMTQKELERAVIGTLAKVDSPIPINERVAACLKRLIIKADTEYVRKIRNNVLALKKSDFEEYGKIALDAYDAKKGRFMAFTSPENVQIFNKEIDKYL